MGRFKVWSFGKPRNKQGSPGFVIMSDQIALILRKAGVSKTYAPRDGRCKDAHNQKEVILSFTASSF
jgi:hypothetical protein